MSKNSGGQKDFTVKAFVDNLPGSRPLIFALKGNMKSFQKSLFKVNAGKWRSLIFILPLLIALAGCKFGETEETGAAASQRSNRSLRMGVAGDIVGVTVQVKREATTLAVRNEEDWDSNCQHSADFQRERERRRPYSISQHNNT